VKQTQWRRHRCARLCYWITLSARAASKKTRVSVTRFTLSLRAHGHLWYMTTQKMGTRLNEWMIEMAIYRDFEDAWINRQLHRNPDTRARLFAARQRMEIDPGYSFERYREALYNAQRTVTAKIVAGSV
jgi:hypothetical protein